MSLFGQFTGKIKNISFEHKLFLSFLAVIFLLSLVIAIFTRWILISTLTSQMTQRGIWIAHNLAQRCQKAMIQQDLSMLDRILVETQNMEKQSFMSYIFVLDKNDQVLSHTFIHGFPQEIVNANILRAQNQTQVKLVDYNLTRVYDIAQAIVAGNSRIGTIRIGINEEPIETLIAKLRNTFVGFLTAITILFFLISSWISRSITRKITQLTKVADQISHGNLDVIAMPESENLCWELKKCRQTDCPAYGQTEIPCWYMDGTDKGPCPSENFPEKLATCHLCQVFTTRKGDEIVQLSHSFNNMTIRLKRSEMELRKTAENYRSLFLSSPNPIFVLDKNTLEILAANPSVEETFGFAIDTIIGRKIIEFGIFESEDHRLELIGTKGWPEGDVMIQKVRYRQKDGKLLYIKIKACPALYDQKEAIILAATDITEMIEKDVQLLQASKMSTLGEMSAGIAHELNQPLNAIKMGNEFLKVMIEKQQEIPTQDLYEVAKQVSGQVDRASEIISRLREFGRISDFAKQQVDINQPIKSAINIMGPQLKLQDIDVKLTLDENLPSVYAHHNRLEQIIFNLITNARDAIVSKRKKSAGAEPHCITIQSYGKDNQAVVEVSDTGTGIPKETMEKIFEPFYTTKKAGKGMGLGLSIIYDIIKDYNGDISVQSQPGHGTTFKYSLPFYKDNTD